MWIFFPCIQLIFAQLNSNENKNYRKLLRSFLLHTKKSAIDDSDGKININ